MSLLGFRATWKRTSPGCVLAPIDVDEVAGGDQAFVRRDGRAMGAVRSGRPNGRAMTAPGAGKHPGGIAGASFRPFVQDSSLLPSVEVWTVSQFSLLPFGRPTMRVHAQARAQPLVRYTGLPDLSVLACVLSSLKIVASSKYCRTPPPVEAGPVLCPALSQLPTFFARPGPLVGGACVHTASGCGCNHLWSSRRFCPVNPWSL